MFFEALATKLDHSAQLIIGDRLAPSADLQTRQDEDPLAAFAEEIAEQLGAAGILISLDGAPAPAVATVGAGAADPRVEHLLRFPPSGPSHFRPTLPSRDGHEMAVRWVGFPMDGQGRWSLMLAEGLLQGHRSFTLRVLLKTEDAIIRSRVERSIRALAPFARAFLQLWEAEAMLQRRNQGLAAALDQSDVGVVLLDGTGRMVFANAMASHLLATGNGLRRSGRTIAATEIGDAVRLQVAVEHSRSQDAADQPLAPVVALRRRDGLRPLMVAVLSPARTTQGLDDIATILYVFDPDKDVEPLLHPVCKLYNLSPVETRLACLLAAGSSLREAACDMRVKEQTARTYLKQIFLKTDTNRQAELVRLMLSSIVRTAHGAKVQIV